MPPSAAGFSGDIKPSHAPTFAEFVAQLSGETSSASARSKAQRCGGAKSVRGPPDPLPWWQKPFHRVKTTADLLGCSSTQVYRLAGEGRLVMKRLAGRVVIETSSIVMLAQAAEPWEASNRGEAGRRKRAELAAQRWR